MSFTLTNDELNILYLNGMTDESIQSDIAFKYGNDMSDEEIYAGYKNMIDELRPVTKTSINDNKNISEWKNKGGIGAFEYGQRNSILYDNIKGKESPADYATRLVGTAAEKVDEAVSKYAPEFGIATKLIGGIARNRVLHEKTDGTTGKDTKIDFKESLGNSIRSGEWLPFIGGFLSEDGLDAKRERTLREKITNGESIYQSDLDFLNYRINKRQEENVRKYTIGGQIADSFLPSLIRFGGEIATGTYVLESLGFASRVAEGASAGQKIAHGLGNMLFSGSINTALPTGWNDIYEAYQGRMLDNETKLFSLTDKGEALFNESFEKPATAFLKSLGQTFIMFASEASGELLGLAGRAVAKPVGKYVATPISEYMGKYVATPISEYLKQNKQLIKFTDKIIPALSKMYEKFQGVPVVGKSYDWLASRVKFDGFLEEMGEEVLEDVLNLTLGTKDEERSLENYSKAIFKSPDEWAILAGAIALQGGTLSVASHLIGSEMEANGASSSEIIEALRGLTESEKEEVIFNKIQSGELNIDELSISNKVTNNIKDELKTNAMNNGVREDLAEKVANLATNMLITRADDNDVDVEDIYKELAPKVQYNDYTPTIQEGSNVTLVGGVSNTDEISQEDIDYYSDLADRYEFNQVENNNIMSKNIEKNFGQSVEDLQIGFTDDIKNILAENEINSDEFEIEDVRLYGSYTTGKNKDASDLDVIVQYKGSMKEDAAFNIFNDENLTITDVNGVERKVDINPINRELSGTIDEHIERMHEIDGAYYQSANTSDAQKEWQEKDTDSKYFKKWTNNSPVVMPEQSMNYDFKTGESVTVGAFHGTNQEFEVFSYDKLGNSTKTVSSKKAFFFSNSNAEANSYADYAADRVVMNEDEVEQHEQELLKEMNNAEKRGDWETYDKLTNELENYSLNARKINGGQKVYKVYLKMNKPMVIDAKNGTPLTGQVAKWIEQAKKDGYDSLILKNIKDNPDGATAPSTYHYVVFNSEQIKSVDNRGTFDEGNPNIYYQSAISSKTSQKAKEVINALKKIANGSEEETVKDLRNDLEQYGGTNDVTFVFGNDKKGIKHIAQKHGAKTLLKVFDTVVDGKVLRYVPKKKTVIISKGDYEAVLSLDENGNKKTWLLSGWNTKEKSSGASSEVSTQSTSTQIKPTFSRQDLGAELNNSINDISDNFNPNNVFYQSAYHGTPHKFDNFSTEHIGSGEGAQAHGWGLYFAGNKNVSEGYRKALSDAKSEWLYDGKPVSYYVKGADIGLYKRTKTIGKKALLEGLNNKLEELETKAEEAKDNHQKEMFDLLGDYAIDFNQIKINETKRQIEIVKNIDEEKIDYKEIIGQLYEVDIPEDDVMLDEDLPISKQPKKVIENLQNLCREEGFNYLKVVSGFYKKMIPQTGKQIYNNLRNYIQWRAEENGSKISNDNSAKEASLLLNKYGIKGIKYNGQQDGECYVVFDDKAVQILNTFYQEEQQSIFDDVNKIREAHVKGSYIPVQNLISLFKTADESTIVHELGHWYLNSLQQDADNGSTKAQEKLDAVRKFVKNNGEELTTVQHEKFAKGFEAYIRSGYAKTNRLKTVFEDFKNSLLKIYDDIKDMFWFDENGNEQRFTEEDLSRINPLFERLMSTENERIQATVFNRIAQLNEEKEKIKEKQYEELAELEDMRNSNIIEGARKEKNKQLTQEFLDRAENFSHRERKETKDYKKRFKDVTLQILSAATGKSKQWVANSRNWDKLHELIETSDGLSSGVGFLREWAEFYAPADLSDNSNDAVGREEEFLQGVYDRLVSGNYSSIEEDMLYQYYGAEFEKEETWRKKFDYLYGKLMTVKNEEKQACFDALFELFSDIPSTDMDFVNECVDKITEAEKYISDKTGSIEKSNAKKNMSLSLQFKHYVLRKLGNQKVYDAEKGVQVNITNTPRLNGLVNKVNTLSDAQNAIRLINNFLIEQIENKQKSILHKEIQKQIKINSQSIKVGALRKGKFDWRTNTIFATLQELNKTPVEEVQKQLGLIAQVDSMADNEQREVVDENTQTGGSIAPQDEQEKLKLAFLEYKSKKVNELDVQQASKLLEGILKLKFEGRRAKNEKELARALETYKTKTNIAEIITKKLSNNETAKYLARWVAGDTWFTSEGTLANWESLLNAIADKNVAQEFSLLWGESEAEVYANKKMVELHNIISQVYGFQKTSGLKRIWNKALDFNEYQEVVKLFREYEKPINTYTVKTASWNRHTKEVSYSDIDINRSQIMMFYGWSQNKQLRERLVNMFGENQLQYLFSQLSIEDKTLMHKLIDFCDSMYADTNEVFINITGLSLPKIENYLPSKAERVLSEVDMLQEGVQNSSVSNFSATKQRKNCSKIKMKAVTPLEVLIPHINKTARYVVLAEKMNYYKKIFIDAPEIKDALINVFKDKTITNNIPVSYDYINYEGDKTKQIKLYVNNDIKVDKIDAVALNPILPFKVSDKPSDNKHSLVDALGLKNGKTKKVTNNNTGETVEISKGTIEKSVSNKISKGVERSDFVNIIYNIENLFETSQKILSHDSYKGESDMRIDRYANIAEVDDNQYLLEFIVKNGEEVKLYSVDAIDKKETAPTNAYVVNDQSALDTVNNSITYIQNFIKSKLVEKYNEDYKDSLKQSKKNKKASKDKGKKTGEKLYSMLVNQLSCSMFDNYAKSLCMAKSLFDTVSNNWISASIGGNFKVLLSQLPAVINYSENMPFGKWATGFASSAKNYKETLKYMFDNWDYLKSRIAGNSKDEILSQVASDYDRFKYFRSFSTANTRWGDVLTLCFGGKPYVDYLINEKGLSKEEAFRKLTESTLRAQTSGHNSATSLWQKKQAQHWLSRMFFAFRNADMQYERKFVDALSQYSKGDTSKKELAKAILLYKVFNPILFSAVVSDLTLFRFLRAILCGDDDDAINESTNMLSTILLSNLNSYGAMGTLANIFAKLGVSRGITNDYVYKPKVPLLGELVDATDKLISKEELTTTDVITSLATIGNYTAGGLPTKRFLTMATGIADSIQGDIGAGLLELLGYGRGTAYNATTGERPPKNR